MRAGIPGGTVVAVLQSRGDHLPLRGDSRELRREWPVAFAHCSHSSPPTTSTVGVGGTCPDQSAWASDLGFRVLAEASEAS